MCKLDKWFWKTVKLANRCDKFWEIRCDDWTCSSRDHSGFRSPKALWACLQESNMFSQGLALNTSLLNAFPFVKKMKIWANDWNDWLAKILTQAAVAPFAQLLLSRDRFSCKGNEKVKQLSEVQAMTPRLFSWQSFYRTKTLWMKLHKLKVMLHYLFLKHFQQIPLSHLGCTFSHEWKAPGRRPQMKTLGNL